MPRGTKRASEDESIDNASRVTKVPRTAKNGGPSPVKEKGATKKGSQKAKAPAKSVPSLADFKAKALPLHLNLTHTPPSIRKEGDIEDEDKEEGKVEELGTVADLGLIGNLTLVPSSFSTGSYGWKGSKRMTVELQAGDEEGGTREKVVVMFTVNATMLGSKPSKGGKGKQGKKEREEEEEEFDAEEVQEPED